eukprot:8108112-Pyramimonas_sp.AAC.1
MASSASSLVLLDARASAGALNSSATHFAHRPPRSCPGAAAAKSCQRPRRRKSRAILPSRWRGRRC